MNRSMFFLAVLLTGGVAVFARPAVAATGIYRSINFQGKMTNTDGTNVTNGSYPFTFTLYDAATGGTQLWTENQTLTVTDGIFRAPLGSVTAFSAAVDFNTDNLYLGINFNADGEMTPRVRFTAVPYAFNAEKVSGLTVTNTTGTLTIPSAKTVLFGDAFTTSGAFPLTLTAGGTTNATLPVGTVTLVDTATTQTLTNKTVGSTGLVFSGAATDINTAAGEALILQGRATSSMTTTAGDILLTPAGNVGIGTPSPGSKLDVSGTINATGYTGAGLTSCSAAGSKLLWTGGSFSCGVDNANPQNVKTTAETASDSVTTSETSLGIPVTITPSSSSNRILLNGFVRVVGTGTANVNVTIRVRRGTATSDPLVVETRCGFSDPVDTNCTWTAVDAPATTSPVTYTVFALGSSAVGTMTNKSIMAMEVTLGADVAELYNTLDATLTMGDVVAIEPGLLYGVRKTDLPYDERVLGIVSTRPALVVGAGEEQGVKSVPVALSGRVPVKVSAENGAIRTGDYLTTSSIPGAAMRAGHAGAIIGQALTSYDGTGIGTVVAFVKTGMYGGTTASVPAPDADHSGALLLARLLSPGQDRLETRLSELFADRLTAGLELVAPRITTKDAAIDQVAPATTHTLQLSMGRDGQIRFVNADGKTVVRINEHGDGLFVGTLTAETIDAKTISGLKLVTDTLTFAVPPVFSRDTAGFAVIAAGTDQVEVTFGQEYASIPVITATLAFDQLKNADGSPVDMKDVASRIFDRQHTFFVSDRTSQGFRIRLNKPAAEDLTFSWIALAVRDAKTHRSISPALPTAAATMEPSPSETPAPSSPAQPSPPEPSPSPFPHPAEATSAGQSAQ